MMAEYRIVRDEYLGYQVQARRWWWPFWVEVGFTNTWRTIEEAERYAEGHAKGCVKYLGKWETTS